MEHTGSMKSIPPKLRKNNKKEYVGLGRLEELFFRLELIVFYLFQCFLIVLAYLSHRDRVLCQPSNSLEPYTKANLVKGPSYEGKKVNIAVHLPSLLSFSFFIDLIFYYKGPASQFLTKPLLFLLSIFYFRK